LQHRDKWRGAQTYKQFVASFETFVFPIIGDVALPCGLFGVNVNDFAAPFHQGEFNARYCTP
jgi:hypothetical protein